MAWGRSSAVLTIGTAATLLLLAPRSVRNASPAPDIQTIARTRHIPLVALTGVVKAEQALNRHLDDAIQDRLLEGWLMVHRDAWWEEWAVRSQRLAARAGPTRLQANKWPTDLVATGYVVSFGPAQLTPRTVLHACSIASSRRGPCDGPIRNIMTRLLSEVEAMELVGVVLDAEASEWEQLSRYPVRKDVALLGTLYSMGGDYYRHRHPDLRKPVYNRFGSWIADRCRTIAAEAHAPGSECRPG